MKKRIAIFIFIPMFILLVFSHATCKDNEIDYWMDKLISDDYTDTEKLIRKFEQNKSKEIKERLKVILFSKEGEYKINVKTLCIRIFVAYNDIESFEILKSFYYDNSIKHSKEFTLIQLTNFSKFGGIEIYLSELKLFIEKKEITSINHLLVNRNLNSKLSIDENTIQRIRELDEEGELLASLLYYYIITQKEDKLKQVINEDIFLYNYEFYTSRLILLYPVYFEKLSEAHIQRLSELTNDRDGKMLPALVMVLLYGEEQDIVQCVQSLRDYQLDEKDKEFLRDIGNKSYYENKLVKNKIINSEELLKLFEDRNRKINFSRLYR